MNKKIVHYDDSNTVATTARPRKTSSAPRMAVVGYSAALREAVASLPYPLV